MNKKIFLIVLIVFVFLSLGGLNIAKKVGWKEPTDGVTWEAKLEGLTATKVIEGSPADLNGIRKGDVLVKINDILVQTNIDVAKNLWIAWNTDQNLSYQILREGEAPLTPTFFPSERGIDLIYFYLILIGLTTLVIGVIIFFNSKKPLSVPYIIFYLLTLSFYGIYVFSPTGQYDVLDNLFFWLDKIAFLSFPALLLHFFLIFPIRKKILKKKPSVNYYLYIPSSILLLSYVFFHLPLIHTYNDHFMLQIHDFL